MYHEVCLVDDSKITNLHHKVLLRQLGLEERAISFTDPEEALDHLRFTTDPSKPVLVLLDIHMPVVSGFEFLEFMELEDLPVSIDVLIVTSSQQAVHRMLAEQFPQYVKGYMVKPLELGALRHYLSETGTAYPKVS